MGAGGGAMREGDAMGHRHDHQWLETFDGAGADRYDSHSRWLAGMHRRTAARVAALLPEGGRLLDVGCGPGRFLSQVAGGRPDVSLTGVDRSERMVELATARLGGDTGDAGPARVLRGDAAALPVPDGSADVVTAILTAHHWEDLARGVGEAVRALAPGGTLLVVEMPGPARHVSRALRDALGQVERRTVWVMGLPLLVGLEARRGPAAS